MMDGSSFCQQNFTTEPIEELVGAVGQKRKRLTSPLPLKSIAPRAEVWTSFTRLKATKDKCTCNYCRKQFKCATTSGNQHDCIRATIKMIILDGLHFSFVDGLGFKQFCSVVCPKYIIPSRRTITRDVVEHYLKEKTVLKRMISESRVSFTMDIWTATTTVSYMVITAHYIDVDWQLHRKIISFKPIYDHKGETIVKQFENCLIDWGIKKVFTITVDNALVNDSAIRILKNKLKCWKDDPLILGGEFMHVLCCAHILDLFVKDGLSELGSSVVSVRNAVKYVRSSNSRFQAFHICAEQEKLTRRSLILDCNTRWNSTYLMLSTALKYRTAFDRMADEDKSYDTYFQDNENGKKRVGPTYLMLSTALKYRTAFDRMADEDKSYDTYFQDNENGKKRVGSPLSNDWENVRRLVQFLKLFYDATLEISSYKKVTSNHCFNDICTIEANLNAFINSRDINMSSMASEMKKKFDKYWDGLEINKLLIIASVFDPRCKMNFVTYCFEILYGKNTAKCIEMKEAVMEVLRKLYEVYRELYAKPSASTNQTESRSLNQYCETSELEFLHVGVCDVPQIRNFVPMYFDMVCEKGDVEKTSNELDIYLMEKVENPTQNNLGMQFDILSWWKKESMKFPILSEIARDVLAVPVSSVASESAFSTSGRILNQYQSSLTPYMVEVLILTQDWLRSSLQSDQTVSVLQILEETEFMDLLEEEIHKSAGQRHDIDL